MSEYTWKWYEVITNADSPPLNHYRTWGWSNAYLVRNGGRLHESKNKPKPYKYYSIMICLMPDSDDKNSAQFWNNFAAADKYPVSGPNMNIGKMNGPCSVTIKEQQCGLWDAWQHLDENLACQKIFSFSSQVWWLLWHVPCRSFCSHDWHFIDPLPQRRELGLVRAKLGVLPVLLPR